MKKMESIGDALFAPLTDTEERRVAAGAGVITDHISFIETNNPNPDESIDVG
jgi:hypothetical protein